MVVFAEFFLMRNILDDNCTENQNTPFLCNALYTFFFENPAFYEIILEYTAEPDRPQMIIRRMRIAYWIRKATNTYSQYVIFIAFPLQQWLHERASALRYTYMDCLVVTRFVVQSWTTN